MKVLVWFQTHDEDNFEGARLRKSIKGALELNDINYTVNPIDYYNVGHFISVRDEGKINECVENGIPVIISCLNCEDDSRADFLEYKVDKKGNRSINLSNKALRVLNKASIITVPSENAKKFLIDSGVTRRIEILSPGVNMSRFDFSRLDEKDLFYRYYGEDRNKKLVVAVGSYSKLSNITTFIKAAKKSPNAIFYYIGPTKKKIPLLMRKDIKFAPKNTRFISMPTDDIYRSILINADIYFYSGYGMIGVNALLEAMAAKCQLIIREQPLLGELLKDGDNGYICSYSETLISVTKDFLEGKLTSTVEKSYKDVAQYNLKSIGEKLAWIYQQAINIK
jgi:1,2-diacylglycerol-3-alpha-glucose alpha-1,2-glucosyltransferase